MKKFPCQSSSLPKHLVHGGSHVSEAEGKPKFRKALRHDPETIQHQMGEVSERQTQGEGGSREKGWSAGGS